MINSIITDSNRYSNRYKQNAYINNAYSSVALLDHPKDDALLGNILLDGSIAESISTNSFPVTDNRDDHLKKLQRLAAGLLPDKQALAVSTCGTYSMRNTAKDLVLEQAIEKSNAESYRQSAKDVATPIFTTCKRIWCCAVCADRITRERQKDLLEAGLEWEKQKDNNKIMLITYTLQHEKGTDILLYEKVLSTAYRQLQMNGYKKLQKEFGIVGAVKNTEYTYSEKYGHNLHYHQALFVSGNQETKTLVASLEDRFLDLWQLEVNGSNTSFQAGATSLVATPIAGANLGYLSKSVTLSNKHSRTSWGLLEDYGNGDRRSGYLWEQFAHATYNKNSLVWSRIKDQLIESEKFRYV